MGHRRRWIWSLVALGSTVCVAVVVVISAVPLRSQSLKARIVEYLSDRLDSEVALDDLALHAFPRLHAVGTGLTIRQRGRTDVPPMIAVRTFTVDADLIGLWRKRVAHVEVSGLDIAIPPRSAVDDPRSNDRRNHRLHDQRATAPPLPGPTPPVRNPNDPGIVIDTLDASGARLVVIPRERDRAPRIWAIHTLTLHKVAVAESMPYSGTLTNAIPPGEIATSGEFGPWNREDPGATPLNGTFVFDKANLGVFTGIAGTLSARGSFGGSLSWIDITGETETPDFLIHVGGHPFALHAKYHTIVDGTNGDTKLERIDARFLESSVVARGAVLDGPPGQHGRTVTLDVDMPKARIEDVMYMVVKAAKPPMKGALKLTTKLVIPPGTSDVIRRLQLNGHFDIHHATFTNYDVQGRIVELSRRGRGNPADQARPQVASDFNGRFIQRNGVLTLEELRFDVPGARVTLNGRYGLEAETIDFKGNLLLDAKVSQTVTGFKSLLLRLADPLFSRPGGGSSIPIKIEGTRTNPKFGLDMSRVFKRGDGF